MTSSGTENPFRLWRELGELMTRNCTVIRYNKNLQQADAKLVELLERFNHINLSDKSQWANTSFAFTRQLYNMLQLSRVIVQGAALRNESRGAHYKPEFPERDDKNFLKTTKAYFAPDADEPRFEFEPVDISLLPPRPRRYDMAK
jgi:succinate dehydrogenase / fumarate reductase flavoprotein subunit